MIDTDLRAHLIELDTPAGSRVYIGNALQGASKPNIVVSRVTGQQPRTLGGRKLFSRLEVNVNVMADDYPDAYPTALAVKEELDGFYGFLGSTSGTHIQSCICISHPADQGLVDGDKVIRWVQATYRFVYSEA